MANKPKIVGITGGIGVGKTTVCHYLVKMFSIPCYEADKEAKRLIQTHPEIVKEIKLLLGDSVYVNGMYDSRAVSQKVMQDPALTQKLNAIVHPRVAIDFAEWCRQQHSPYVLKEAALLVESGSYKECDFLIVVTAPEDIRIRRVMKRDPQRSEQELRNIMARQLPENDKIKLANFVIYNDDEKSLVEQLNDLHQRILLNA